MSSALRNSTTASLSFPLLRYFSPLLRYFTFLTFGSLEQPAKSASAKIRKVSFLILRDFIKRNDTLAAVNLPRVSVVKNGASKATGTMRSTKGRSAVSTSAGGRIRPGHLQGAIVP